MGVLSRPDPWLLSAVSANSNGAARDTRHALNAAYVLVMGSAVGGASGGVSAIVALDASHDATAWLLVQTWTATATYSATAQLAGYFPYVRGRAVSVYSAGGGSGTGVAWMHYIPVV